MLGWHLMILLVSMCLKPSFLDPRKSLYASRKWEKNGSFYIKKLRIKKWKDFLPQYVARGGFSKRHLESNEKFNEKYINVFIIETCRAEWNHVMCSMYFIVSFSINSLCYALVFSTIPLIVNIPFIAIQRYNRIRLKKLEQKCAHSKMRKAQEVSC
jgi:glycosyl-4,4'-diaponeurosporenoate acyltransferase